MHIIMNRHARCDCKLWNALWYYNVFGHFHTLLLPIHVWIVSSNISLIIRLINTHHILIYWHARCHSRLWNASWFYSVFSEFCTQLTNIHVWSKLVSCVSIYGYVSLVFIISIISIKSSSMTNSSKEVLLKWTELDLY